MNPLRADQERALSELATALDTTPWVLIGATALACQIGMSWRTTQDLDVAVAVDLEDLEARLGAMDGWTRDPRAEQTWRSAEGAMIDVIPAGRVAMSSGVLKWPRSGRAMNLAGMDHALQKAVQLPMTRNLTIPVASVPVIFLLKAAAYLDRPTERDRDLSDLGHILEDYPGQDDSRRFDPEVRSRGLTHEESGPFVLGREMAAFVHPPEREVLDDFVARVVDATDGGTTKIVMLRLGPRIWNRDEREIVDRVKAFRAGLNASGAWRS